MTTAAQVIATAKSQIGTKESPFGSNRQKYGVWYGWNGVPWCDQFLSWCFAQSKSLTLIGGKSASVALTASRMRALGRYGSTPRIGALAFFNNYSHIELVTGVNSNGTITTIGGNTGPSSISNGGGVYANTRSRSLIRGYGYPAYTGTPKVTAPPKPSVSTDLVVDGVFGPNTIKRLQRWVGVSQTGVMGSTTNKALQRKVGVTQDGKMGPVTVKALQRVVGVRQDGAWGSITTRALQTYLNRIF